MNSTRPAPSIGSVPIHAHLKLGMLKRSGLLNWAGKLNRRNKINKFVGVCQPKVKSQYLSMKQTDPHERAISLCPAA
jgi:hypothetical protein